MRKRNDTSKYSANARLQNGSVIDPSDIDLSDPDFDSTTFAFNDGKLVQYKKTNVSSASDRKKFRHGSIDRSITTPTSEDELTGRSLIDYEARRNSRPDQLRNLNKSKINQPQDFVGVDDFATSPSSSSGKNTSSGSASGGSSAPNNMSKKAKKPNTSNPDEDLKNNQLFEPNPLNDFENPTYHIKFFMTEKDATFSNVQNKKQIIIAESGSTGNFIDDFEVQNVASANMKTSNSTDVKINFVVVEPLSATLFDQMQNAAESLDYERFKFANYWVEITWKGYSGPGYSSDQGGHLKTLKTEAWRTAISIINVEAELESGKTVYKFSTTSKSDEALRDRPRRTRNFFTIQANTFGEFIDLLQENLNRSESNFTKGDEIGEASTKVNRFEYVIKYSPDLEDMCVKDWILRSDNTTGQNRNSLEKAKKGGQKKGDMTHQITVESGADIISKITEIFGSTVEGQKLAVTGVYDGPSLDTTGNGKPSKDPLIPSKIPFIDADIEYIGYDKKTNQNVYRIFYWLKLYQTFIPVSTPEDLNEIDRVNYDRLKNLVLFRRIKKKYEYNYTGMNTDVLNFNLNVNLGWQVQLPSFKGQSHKQTVVQGSKYTKQQSIIQIRQNLITEKFDQLVKLKNEKANLIAERDKAIQQGARPTDPMFERYDKKRFESLDRKIKNRQDDIRSDITQSIESTVEVSTGVTPTRADEFVLPSSGSINVGKGKNRVNGEPISTTRSNQNVSGSSFNLKDEFTEDFIGPAYESSKLNISIDTEEATTTTGSSIEGTSSRGRSFFYHALQQTFGASSDLINFKMEIRGDPYWLGNSHVRERNTDPVITVFNEGNYRNFTDGDALIFFRTVFPKPYDDGDGAPSSLAGTGFQEINNKTRKFQAFNGLFKVITIVHKFNEGKFTQEFRGTIDPLTKEESAQNFLEGKI